MNYVRNLLYRQLLWLAQQDPDGILVPVEADPTELRMKDMSCKLFNPDLFLEPYEQDDDRLDGTQQLWHPVSGFLERSADTCRLLPADGSRAIDIHPVCACRLDDRGSGTPVVLLYDLKNPGTGDQILVTQAEYQLSDPLPTVYDKAHMLLEYLKLDKPLQKQVFSFLTEEDFAENTFAAMCRTALKACQVETGLSAPPNVLCEDPEQRAFWDLLGFFSDNAQQDLWALCILLAVHKLICLFLDEDPSTLKELIRADVCCRHSALAECVERLLPTWDADFFAQLLLSVELDPADVFAFARIRFWLFALLEARIPLSKPVLQEICRKHLAHPMTGRLLCSLRSGLFSDNCNTLHKCIEALYPEKYALPSSGFPAALAVIRIHNMHYKQTPIQEEAQRLLLEGTTEGEILLGIAMLTVALQFRPEHKSYTEPVVLTREAEVTARVLGWLQEPESIRYPHVCELAQQLYLSCAVAEDAFADPQVIHAACTAWGQKICPTRVEALLSTLPMGMTLPQNNDLLRMRLVLGTRFDKAMLGETHTEKILPLFRCCAVLGCWETVYLQRRFALLLKKIDGIKEYRFGENREYMGRLEWDMLNTLIRSTPEERDTPPSKSRKAAHSSAVSDRAQAIGLLKSFRNAIVNDDLQSAVQRFRRRAPDIQEPYLITDWFYALCTMGLCQEAQAFYLLHKDVLDRPWIYLPDPSGMSVERPYHAASCFWNGQPRLEKGLELAAGMGHPVEQWPLAQQRMLTLSLDKKKVLRFFHNQYCPNKNRAMNHWMTHYDDCTVTRDALRNPKNHYTILSFGYCNSKEMVLTALQADPSHVYYASKALRKDDQVARTVLRQSCQHLHLLFAPVTEDREWIKDLIRRQEEPVILYLTKEWVRDDKELMLSSVAEYPQYFELVSERLRQDRDVVLAALNSVIQNKNGNGWLRHVLQHTSPELREDPEIIRCIRKQYPDLGSQEEE